METTHLEEFVYLAKTLSFKRTAEHFFVSRSVISRHLAALEETLGAKLVERNNHAVALTPVGEAFYRDALILLRDYETAVEHARIVGQERARIVRIGYLRNAARPVLVQFVRLMKRSCPDVRLSLTCMEYGDLRRAMGEGAVDIALAVNVDPSVSRNYRSTRIYTDRFFAVMSKDDPLATQADGVRLEDIPEDKLLLPDSFVYAGLSDLLDGLVESKTQLVAREYYSDVDMLYLKVQTEGYIAFSSGMNNAMFGDALAILPVRGLDSSFSVSAFYRDGLAPDLVDLCRTAFEQCCDSMKGWGGAGAPPIGLSLGSFAGLRESEL